MLVSAVALLCLGTYQQATFSWSAIPNVDKKITLNMPLTTLTEVTETIRREAGVPIRLSLIPEQKLTVLVREMKVSDLLEELADLLDLQLNTLDSKVGIALSGPARDRQASYLAQEDRLITKEADERLDALVAAVPTVFAPAPESDSKPESLQAWAKQKIRLPAGYAVALARQTFLRTKVHLDWMAALPLNMHHTPFDVCGYAFKAPPNAKVASWGHRSLDEFSNGFGGTQVLIRYRQVAGSWMVKTISRNDAGQIDDNPKLLRYPHPPRSLSSHPFAISLAEWAKGDPDSKVGAEKISHKSEGDDPLFPNQGPSLADHLAWLHANSKANIVATAFRVPTALKTADLTGDTVAECLDFLARKTACFVSLSKRCVRIRQGGYWRLAVCEPTEASLRQMESIAKQRELTLDDYGRFAASVEHHVFERFEGPNRILANFDLRPLERGAQILSMYGRLSSQQRKALWNGNLIRERESSIIAEGAIHGAMGEVNIVGRFGELLEYPNEMSYLTDLYLATNDQYWMDSREGWPASFMKLIIPTSGSAQNVGLFLTPNNRDGILFWFKG